MTTRDAAQTWLERDVLGNLELLLALKYDPISELVVAGESEQVCGALLRSLHPTRDGLCIRLDAQDDVGLAKLLALRQPMKGERWLLHRPWIASSMGETYTLTGTGYGLLSYACTSPNDIPPLGRLLTADDAPLVGASNCGWSEAYFRQLLTFNRRPWGILHDDRIVCRAASGYGTTWTEEVISLWTDPAYRGRSLARSLVAQLCDDILLRKPYATYTTTADNLASQHVAQAVGLQSISTATEYLIT